MTDLILYLHNDPTPPEGDTPSHPVLPMDDVLPAVSDLFNYDTDRDGAPGLVIAKGGNGPDGADDAKHQHWVTAPFSAALVIEGDASVKLWTAMKDFSAGLGGAVTVYLRDCYEWDYGWSCVGLGSDTVATNPQAGSTWTLETFSVSIGTYTIAPVHKLELVVVVDASSDDDMWFAYDTNDHKSRVTVSASASSLEGSEAVLPNLVTRWFVQTWARSLFA
ncbi:MAG TPA: hypothetical protein VJ578_04895 [Dehalococcoidia bacterium]|nr:hypothetical protein [Dehalococcoidia bacterium]